ncbi:MAG: universal stress protein [Anaerolineae bacterium]|nr:universal stress protein [Anaerolineae bacterium]
MFKKILVPLDGSALAELALPYAREIAKINDAEIVLAYVEEDYTARYYPYAMDMSILMEVAESTRAEMNNALQKKAELLMEAGFKPQIAILKSRNPAEAILEYVDQKNVDLIIITTHGYTGMTRFFIGSVTDRIVNHSKIPVMVIRPETTEVV